MLHSDKTRKAVMFILMALMLAAGFAGCGGEEGLGELDYWLVPNGIYGDEWYRRVPVFDKPAADPDLLIGCYKVGGRVGAIKKKGYMCKVLFRDCEPCDVPAGRGKPRMGWVYRGYLSKEK